VLILSNNNGITGIFSIIYAIDTTLIPLLKNEDLNSLITGVINNS